jgi:hypothetical protein
MLYVNIAGIGRPNIRNFRYFPGPVLGYDYPAIPGLPWQAGMAPVASVASAY